MAHSTAVALLAAAALIACGAAQAKQSSRLVTAEMRGHALENAQRLDWARSAQENARNLAAPWLNVSDEDLWKMIPSQELPRAVFIARGILYEGKKDACPKCGGPVWDNRPKKAENSTRSKWPDFSCRDKTGCQWAVWPGQYEIETSV